MSSDHPEPVSPALLRHLRERGKRRENRVADQITRFGGSMKFVYLHAIWFSLWIGLRLEHYPFGLLTMIVSLEAIFLSTFVMISQNRADEKCQVIADEAWRTVQKEEQQNETLLRQFNEILDLTKEIHAASASATSKTDGSPGKHPAHLLPQNLGLDKELGAGQGNDTGPGRPALPARVRRGFHRLAPTLGTQASAPKSTTRPGTPRRHPPGATHPLPSHQEGHLTPDREGQSQAQTT